MKDDPNELIDVCDKCLTACCWHGELMCQDSREAGLVKITRVELIKLGREHSSYFDDVKLIKMGIKSI